MTPFLARDIADEHIAWWRARGVSSTQAWEAMFGPVWGAAWWEVRARMIHWLLNR